MKCGIEVCQAISLTSLAWILLDSFFLIYFLKDDVRRSPSKPSECVPIDEEKTSDVDPDVQFELDLLLNGTSFERDGPGVMGSPVYVEPQYIDIRNEMFKVNEFDLMASNMISVIRPLPDLRTTECRISARKYKNIRFPTVSVIIVFHNEAWSTLLRTIHSVINRSSRDILKEIILIDDLSDQFHLKETLDAYVKTLSIPVHIVHLPERSGLIKARLVGTDMAKGEALLFLDAHIEVTEGWIEPLLYRIKQDRSRIVSPVIDVISDETFQYLTTSENTWGGFDWNLNFRWYPVPPREQERRKKDPSMPMITPVIAGGLFAIDRQYFYDLGTYDEGMEVWGGENLEISFRAWMCGGSLEIHPCSRVGHVFRKKSPYTFPGDMLSIIRRNTVRTNEVWLDDHKQFYYVATPEANLLKDVNVTARKEFRKSLRCNSFKWYLENIFPESTFPASFLSIGEIRTERTNHCLYGFGEIASVKPLPVGITGCNEVSHYRAWSYTGKGELRSNDRCLGIPEKPTKKIVPLELQSCSYTSAANNHQRFIIDQKAKLIKHRATGRCVELNASGLIVLATCDSQKEEQRWNIDNYSA